MFVSADDYQRFNNKRLTYRYTSRFYINSYNIILLYLRDVVSLRSFLMNQLIVGVSSGGTDDPRPEVEL